MGHWLSSCARCGAWACEGPPAVAPEAQGPPWRTEAERSSPSGRRPRSPKVFEKYDVVKELGHGEFGVVWSVVHKDSRKKYAIKSISKHQAESQAKAEAEILFHLGGHSNICSLYEMMEDEHDIHLVMEQCEGGSWHEKILSRGTFSEPEASDAIRVLLLAVSHCHALGVVHRDIKADNIMFKDSSGSSDGLKLLDFGLAELSPLHASHMARPLCPTGACSREDSSPQPDAPAVGSTWYMSPEVLLHRGAGKECDIWSIGVLLYISLAGHAPFDGPTEPQIFYAIKYEPLNFCEAAWAHVSINAKDFVGRMLCKDPCRRASIEELLGHPWLGASQVLGRARSENRRGGARGSLEGGAPPPPRLPDVLGNRLRRFAGMNLLAREARKVLPPLLKEEQVAGLVKIFNALDLDGDGSLSPGEVHSTMVSRGFDITEAKATELMERCGLCHLGVMARNDFLAATLPDSFLDPEHQALLSRCFAHFDADGDGFIDEEDLRKLPTPPGVEVDAAAIMRLVDADRDDLIGPQDFCTFLRRTDEEGVNADLWPPPSRRRCRRAASAKACLSASIKAASTPAPGFLPAPAPPKRLDLAAAWTPSQPSVPAWLPLVSEQGPFGSRSVPEYEVECVVAPSGRSVLSAAVGLGEQQQQRRRRKTVTMDVAPSPDKLPGGLGSSVPLTAGGAAAAPAGAGAGGGGGEGSAATLNSRRSARGGLAAAAPVQKASSSRSMSGHQPVQPDSPSRYAPPPSQQQQQQQQQQQLPVQLPNSLATPRHSSFGNIAAGGDEGLMTEGLKLPYLSWAPTSGQELGRQGTEEGSKGSSSSSRPNSSSRPLTRPSSRPVSRANSSRGGSSRAGSRLCSRINSMASQAGSSSLFVSATPSASPLVVLLRRRQPSARSSFASLRAPSQGGLSRASSRGGSISRASSLKDARMSRASSRALSRASSLGGGLSRASSTERGAAALGALRAPSTRGVLISRASSIKGVLMSRAASASSQCLSTPSAPPASSLASALKALYPDKPGGVNPVRSSPRMDVQSAGDSDSSALSQAVTSLPQRIQVQAHPARRGS